MDGFYLLGKSNNKKNRNVIAIAVLAIFVIVGIGLFVTQSTHNPIYLKQFELEEQEFLEYAKVFNKKYTSESEFQQRFRNFVDNAAYIRIHNSQNYEWTLGVNEFADMSFQEFGDIYLHAIKVPEDFEEDNHQDHYAGVTAPTTID